MFKYLGVVDGRHTAQISDDNLQIAWHGETGPDWDALYMEQYHKEFMSALSDYRVLQRAPITNSEVWTVVNLDKE